MYRIVIYQSNKSRKKSLKALKIKCFNEKEKVISSRVMRRAWRWNRSREVAWGQSQGLDILTRKVNWRAVGRGGHGKAALLIHKSRS